MFVVWILFLIVVEYFFFLVYFLFYFSFFFSFFLLFFFIFFFFFFSSRRRHTRSLCDWSSDGVLFRSPFAGGLHPQRAQAMSSTHHRGAGRGAAGRSFLAATGQHRLRQRRGHLPR